MVPSALRYAGLSFFCFVSFLGMSLFFVRTYDFCFEERRSYWFQGSLFQNFLVLKLRRLNNYHFNSRKTKGFKLFLTWGYFSYQSLKHYFVSLNCSHVTFRVTLCFS